MKKLLSICLAAALLLSLGAPALARGAAAAGSGAFADVDAGAYYADAVDWAVGQCVTNGTKEKDAAGPALFSPERTVKRCEAVTFLWRAFGRPAPQTARNPFADVAARDYFYEPVLWAVEKGVTVGRAADSFAPDEPVKRSEMLTFLWRAMGKPEKSEDYDGKPWYADAEFWAYGAGTLGSTELQYRRADGCPRCDVVYYLHNAMLWRASSAGGTVQDSVRALAEAAPGFGFSGATWAEDNPERRMAHNIYADPDLSGTSGQFVAFSVDFCTDAAPKGTYWALCNWGMDLTELERGYTVTDRGGAYAGLQMTTNAVVPSAIMSFWEIHYRGASGAEGVIRAHRVYPAGDEHSFGGEGEGTNYLCGFDWEADHWYRMLLMCYDDDAGETFVEQWIMDLETGTWTLISRFDTGLKRSCFVGGMSQFMENYLSETSNELRSFRCKNAYVRDRSTWNWVPLTRFTLSTDTQWDNKKGSYAFGADGDTIWGITNGCGTDVLKTRSHGPISGVYTVPVTAGPPLD